MNKRSFVWVEIGLGSLFALCAAIVLFVAPTEALYENGARLHFGDIFRGLEALIGAAGARLLLALPFALFSMMFLLNALPMPKTRKRRDPSKKLVNGKVKN